MYAYAYIPGRMARAMSANLGEGANSGGPSLQFSAGGQPLRYATYDFTKAEVAIHREGANFGGGASLQFSGGGQRQGGPFARGVYLKV
jgi:hypothetical protein